ncbi:MAG TPA: glycosyltransferase family 2 protein [Candidatus Dormibacteraeota bacterium]
MTASLTEAAPARGAPDSVSAVLPAHNEVAVIAGVIERTHAALLSAAVADFEIVVVDDGSTDGTGEAVRVTAARLAADGPRAVHVVTHPVNRGYGAALSSGFEAARCDHVWLMDSDGQFDPADLTLLLAAWRPGRFVAGYRAQRADAWPRRLNHDAFFGLVRVAIGPTVRDVNCAFKLFPRRLGLGLRAQGAMISTELVLRARSDGVQIVEVAVPHHPRTAGTPTGASPRVVAKAFAELWELNRAVRRGRRGPHPVAEEPDPE